MQQIQAILITVILLFVAIALIISVVGIVSAYKEDTRRWKQKRAEFDATHDRVSKRIAKANGEPQG